MAFQVKQAYRGLNGAELKDIIPARVREAMLLDNVLNVARGFPLLRYEVKITLTPYHSAGRDRANVEQVAPDAPIVYLVDGEYFVPVEPAALELVEDSPIYGKDADPQALRTLAQQGTVESVRTSTGELVDIRTKPGSKEPAIALPLVHIPDPPPPPPDRPLTQAESTAAQQASPSEDPDTTYKIEESRWAGSHSDPAIEKASRLAIDDPEAALRAAPGRVSVVGERGQQRGRR